jgi:hypothetical protein
VESWAFDEVLDNLYALSDRPVLPGELLDLLRYRYEQIDFIDEPVDLGFGCPLDLHCTYTRDQLLVALDFLKPATVREGVKKPIWGRRNMMVSATSPVPTAPPHYGDRYGRWYYGKGHQYGCEFGENK